MSAIRSCALFVLGALPLLLSAQQPLTEQFQAFDKTLPQERLYAHTDRTLYAPGDAIWLSAYLTDASNRFSKASTDFSVQLLQPNGSILYQTRMKADPNAPVGAVVDLPKDAVGGIYTLRLQSDWMMNFGQVFEKKITVQKVVLPRLLMKLELEREAYGAGSEVMATLRVRTANDKPLANKMVNYQVLLAGQPYRLDSLRTDAEGNAILQFQLPPKLSSDAALLLVQIPYEGSTESISRAIPLLFHQLDLQFLPEGGSWIAGFPQRLAFKALNHYGQPADLRGEILDEAGKVVTSFDSYHDGMGMVELQGVAGGNYRARITEPAGIETLYDLPYPQPQGVALRLDGYDTLKNRTEWTIYCSEAQSLTLVAQAQGKIWTQQNIAAKAGKNTVSLNVDSLPMAVAQFTLFNAQQQPLAERLVFVNTHRSVQLSIRSDKESYLPRERVTLTIETRDETGLPVSGVLSVAVVEDKQFTFIDDRQDHILSGLLLSSDLRGAIHEPSFYFDKKEEKAHAALDLVLMTHGWRRFDWTSITQGKREDWLSLRTLQNWQQPLSGRVELWHEGHSWMATHKPVRLRSQSDQKVFARSKTDDSGKFSFLVNTQEHPLPWVVETRYRYLRGVRDIPYLPPSHPDTLRSNLQNAHLTGILTHSNKTPAAYTEVELWKGNQRVTTVVSDVSGAFQLNHLAAGDYQLRIREQGRQAAVHQAITLKQKTTETVKINLPSVQPPRLIANQNEPEVPTGEIAEQPIAEADKKEHGVTAGAYFVQVIDAHNANDAVMSGNILADEIIWDLDQSKSMASLESVMVSVAGVTRLDAGSANLAGFLSPMDWLPRSPGISVYVDQGQGISYYTARTFYAPLYSSTETTVRNDFRKTLYWNPTVITNLEGRATLSFCASDEVSTFRVIAEGLVAGNKPARHEKTFSVQSLFSMEQRTPPTVAFADTVHLTFILKNNTPNPLIGMFSLDLPKTLVPVTDAPLLMELRVDSFLVVRVPVRVATEPGIFEFSYRFNAKGFQEKATASVEIVPQGFPRYVSIANKAPKTTRNFVVSEVIDGSLVLDFKAYPNMMSQTMDGLESMLHEPYGCFEQTTSTNYPNILALDYMKQSNQLVASVRDKALSYLEIGYERLVGYECTDGGFDWFGNSPAHEGLTAMGIMQFIDLKTVYDGVDDAMVQRTVRWLMSRRDGKGGWHKNEHYLHTWANGEVMDAYIVWALSEAGYAQNILPEIEAATAAAHKSEDLYRMALTLLANQKAENTSRMQELATTIRSILAKQKLDKLPIESTVTSSAGISASVETIALLGLALMRMPDAQLDEVSPLMDYISQQRSPYGFGSTQATVLGLKALTAFAEFNRKPSEDGTIAVTINGQTIRRDYTTNDRGDIVITDLNKHIKTGENTVSIEFLNTKKPLEFWFDLRWHSRTPDPAGKCPVHLTTAWNKQSAAVGDVVHLSAVVENRSNKGQPSAIATIGIPSGLSLQPWQLKELMDKKLCDYYEIRGNQLVLYYAQLPASARYVVELDLKADIAGSYQCPASAAYLYYTPEERVWVRGERVVVR